MRESEKGGGGGGGGGERMGDKLIWEWRRGNRQEVRDVDRLTDRPIDKERQITTQRRRQAGQANNGNGSKIARCSFKARNKTCQFQSSQAEG